MGHSVSKAKEAAAKENKRVDQMLQVLHNKLEAMELVIKSTRGSDSELSKTEVASGRTVMRVSEIRIADNSGPDEQLTAGIHSFFNAAQSSVAGDDQGAKTSAIKGAESLLSSGMNALFGVTNGQGMEKQSFVVLFINNAFVRVDYYIYSYSVSAKEWGAEANSGGMCYIADLAVLDMAAITAAEIDFLASQALQISDGDFDKLMQVKISLIEVSILSNALRDTSMSFDKLSEISKQLGTAQKSINDTFKQLETYKGPAPESKDGENKDTRSTDSGSEDAGS